MRCTAIFAIFNFALLCYRFVVLAKACSAPGIFQEGSGQALFPSGLPSPKSLGSLQGFLATAAARASTKRPAAAAFHSSLRLMLGFLPSLYGCNGHASGWSGPNPHERTALSLFPLQSRH